jgi:hypothetical protein
MALFEAIVFGGMIGAVVEGGKRGLIKQWRNADELPPLVKLLMIGILVVIPAVNAGAWDNYIVTALATVGAFTLARWSVASLLVIWRRLR